MARITLDYTPAVHQAAGIGRLTREVTRELLALDTPHQFRLFCMGRPPSAAGRRSMVVCPLTDRWLYRVWHRARLPVPVEVFAGPFDLYHATDFVLPPTRPGARTVLTVHDLTFERAPDAAPPQLLRFLKRVVPQSARRAAHIVADSQATARDLAELYGIPPGKITVIYSGVDERFRPEVGSRQSTVESTGLSTFDCRLPTSELRRKYAFGDAPFILTVGTLQPRKNHLTLVRAFAHLSNLQSPISDPQSPIPNLVIAGGTGWQYDEVAAEVARLGLGERVKFAGFVDDADLPALYRTAAVFAFPSLYEGFGIPVLEAMASGVPVVASNASSLPEVLGDAGLAVDPLDIGGLAAALERALTDDAWRAGAIARGLARARQFTWRRAAEQLLEVYERTLRGAASR